MVSDEIPHEDQVFLDVMPCWPVSAVTLFEDIYRKIQQIWLTKQEDTLKA
jgi:hypothetical protein